VAGDLVVSREGAALVTSQQSLSPWWYRHRSLMMLLVYWLSFYTAYGIPKLLHQTSLPIFLAFGPGRQHIVFAVGFALLAGAWLLRAWGASYLRPEVVWRRDTSTDNLCTDGPFRFSRNPLYLGNLFMAAAIGLFVPPTGWAVVVLAQWVFIRALIAEEESNLLARYGTAFESYAAGVPRLRPRTSPFESATQPHAPLANALASEPLMAGFTAGFAVLAIFGFAAWLPAAGVVLLGAIAQPFVNRRLR
jgi:protein-S-isoprenylcysteine O-methyltransferase Ste14